MRKKLLAAILAPAMIFALAACGSSAATAPAETSDTGTAAEETSAAAPETRTVTDTWGREAEIPYSVKSIVCLGSGAPRMAAYLDVVDMMAGAEDHDK